MMIIKIIGMLLVMVSASFIGYSFSQCFVSRETELFNLADSVELIINELEYSMEPVKHLFYRVQPFTKGCVNDLYTLITRYIGEGMEAADAWSVAIEKTSPMMCLKKSDCNYLKTCSDMFYAYEAEQQKNQLRALKNKIEQLADEAAVCRRKNSRLAGMLGIYGGVLICAVLF